MSDDQRGPYIHEDDVPPVRGLSFIETCQSAERLVELGFDETAKQLVQAVGMAITCPCRERNRPMILTPDEASAKPTIRTVEVMLKKFNFKAIFPFEDPATSARLLPFKLEVRGACGLCPECQTLYYVHF